MHGVTVGVTDSLKLCDKVHLKYGTFICMDRLKLLPDTGSSGLAFDLDKGGAVNSPVNDFAEHRLLLFIGIDLFLMSLQLVISEWQLRLSLGFKETSIAFL